MAGVEKISVAVTPEMAGLMRGVVAAGEYASASEVVREALRDWQRRREERQSAVAELTRLWEQGINSGDAGDSEEVFEALLAKHAAK